MEAYKKSWGYEQNREVFLFELNACGLRARVSNYGGILQALYVNDANGIQQDVVLGYDTLEEYRSSDTFFGAMVGPVADRIDGGKFTAGGKNIQLPLNAGPDTMHSGSNGFHAKVWDWEFLSDGIGFFRTFSSEETGFPGILNAKLTYRIPDENVLRIEYAAVCDHDIPVSFTNHSYFNLDGGKNHCRDHVLSINASRYAQTIRENDPICNGNTPTVEGTPFDFRNGKRLGDALSCTGFHEIQTGGGVDHFFLVDGEGMREHAGIYSGVSGISLSCRSDAPGVLVYSGNGLMDEPGKGNNRYGKNFAICLETERFPNGVNLPAWRDQVMLPANTPYESAAEFIFAVQKPG